VFDSIDAAGLEAMLARQPSPQLIDVRTAAEVARGRIAGARNIDLSELPRRLAEIDPEQPCVLYCHSGARSTQACALLARNGYVKLYNLSGGIAAWAAAGKPVQPQ
jgi:rhodanese-related sulfurtransferase